VHRGLNLPDLFLAISLGLIALEAALARWSVIKAKYRAMDTFASLSMQAGNIAMNLMMAGVVFAGLSAVYRVRLFDISVSSPWAWFEYLFNRPSHHRVHHGHRQRHSHVQPGSHRLP